MSMHIPQQLHIRLDVVRLGKGFQVVSDTLPSSTAGYGLTVEQALSMWAQENGARAQAAIDKPYEITILREVSK